MTLKYYKHLQKLIQAMKADPDTNPDLFDNLSESVGDITNYVSEAGFHALFLKIIDRPDSNEKTKTLKENLSKGSILNNMIAASRAMKSINELCSTYHIDPIFTEPKNNRTVQTNAFDFTFELFTQSCNIDLHDIEPVSLEDRVMITTK